MILAIVMICAPVEHVHVTWLLGVLSSGIECESWKFLAKRVCVFSISLDLILVHRTKSATGVDAPGKTLCRARNTYLTVKKNKKKTLINIQQTEWHKQVDAKVPAGVLTSTLSEAKGSTVMHIPLPPTPHPRQLHIRGQSKLPESMRQTLPA